jgi:RNA polymerase sigma factor for flagellar operon FliA
VQPATRITANDELSVHLSVDDLVTSHLALVGHITRETAARLPRHVDSDDLMGAGALALVQAAQAFDPALGVPFARFANTRVRGAMIDHMRSRDWASRSVRARSRAIDEVAETLTAALHRAPSVSELAAASGLAESEIREVRAGASRATVLSLDPALDDAEGPIGRLTDAAPRPDEALIAAERMGYLRDAIAELPQRQRDVVVRYYLDQDQLTDIAEDLGVTQSRASQLRSEGLDLLREALTELLHDEARVGAGYEKTDQGEQDGVRARRRAGYVAAVAARSSVHQRADVNAYLAGTPLAGAR